MNRKQLMRAIWRAQYPQGGGPLNGDGNTVDILIQLPDNEPPVNFTAEVFEDTVILFPTPPIAGHGWDHNTNVITSSPSAMPPGEYAVTIDPDLLVRVAKGKVPVSRLAVRDGALVDFKA